MGHLNSAKHKANHGGYKQKPTRESVRALLNLYTDVNSEFTFLFGTSGKGKPKFGTPKPGTQLKLF